VENFVEAIIMSVLAASPASDRKANRANW